MISPCVSMVGWFTMDDQSPCVSMVVLFNINGQNIHM